MSLSQLRLERRFRQYDLDSGAVRHWYHFTILFMLKLNNRIPASFLAKSLMLEEEVVVQAIQELRESGLISAGDWDIAEPYRFLETPDNSPSIALLTRL